MPLGTPLLLAEEPSANPAPAVAPAAQAAPGGEQVIADGKTISFDYTLTVDGKEVDSSAGKQPLEYVQGEGKIIPGLEKAIIGMKIGEEKEVKVSPEEAYGMPDEKGIQEIQKSLIPSDIELAPGTVLEMSDASGNVFPATVKEIKDQTVILDFNHPLAGKELNFKIKIVSIK